MGFPRREDTPALDSKGKVKVLDTKKVLQTLQKKIDANQAQVKQIKDLSSEIDTKESQVLELGKNIKDLKEEKEKEESSHNDKLEIVQAQITESNVELNEVETLIGGKKIELGEATKKVKKLNDAQLEISRENEDAKNETSTIKNRATIDIGRLSTELANKNSEIEKQKTLLSRLQDDQTRILGDISNMKEDQKQAKKARDTKNKLILELKQLEIKVDKSGINLIGNVTKANKILEEAKKKADDREKLLNEREGDIDLREGWLGEKEESLRTVKQGLEKKLGKQIKNIEI